MRKPSARSQHRDAGLSLIEVVVAMVVFGVIATGIIGSVSISMKMTPDNESREVAANLAAQEVDLVRAVGDPYQVGARETAQAINGRTYTIHRSTGWLQPNGVAGTCGASTANFELQVDVDVSWTGQAATTKDVRSNTILAPLSTLTTGTTGALAITVDAADLSPQPGVSLTVAPDAKNPNGATTPASQPAPTGSDGCSYLAKLTPGNYDVTAKLTGPGGTQTATTANPKAVAAGSTTPVPLTLDGTGTLTPNEADNADGEELLPTDLVISYLSGGIAATSSAAKVVVKQSTSGYTAVAGKVGAIGGAETCPEFDPSQWAAGTANGVALKNGTLEARVPLQNGQTRPIGVPMGTVTVALTAGLWVKAVQATATGTGNPGCSASATTVHFDQLTDDTAELALPYGSWKLYVGPLQGAEAIPVLATQITGTSNVAGGIGATGVVTLDPRQP